MTNLDTIVQTYIQDTKFSQKRKFIAGQRRASIPYYNTIVHKFVKGIYNLDEFREALKTLNQDTFWGARSYNFLMELNKLANNHVPVSPDVEIRFRLILDNLNAQNVGQRIEQFYDLLTQEKEYLEILEVSSSKIASPGNSAFIISLMAFWLDHTAAPYICYPSLRSGLRTLLNTRLLLIPADIQLHKDIEIQSEADYQTLTYIFEVLAASQPDLKSGEYWEENFLLWVTENHEMVLAQSHVQQNALPYTPLPKEASQVALDCFTQLGFDKKAIVEKYKFSSTQNNYITLNALVFAHPSQRDFNNYASITLLNAINDYNDDFLVTRLSESSAPFHLIHHENVFALWASGIQVNTNKKMNVRPIPINASIPYDRLKDVIHSYADDLRPQRIIEAKQGRNIFKHFPKEVNPVHLSLWAGEIRSKPLVKHFEQTINVLKDNPAQLSHDDITMIVTQLIGLLVLADTGTLGEDIRHERCSLGEMLDKAHEKYPHFFDISFLLNTYFDAVEQAYQILKHIQYAGFTLDMLDDFHKTSYRDKKQKKLEIHNVPLYLSHRILDNIPLEFLRPHERVIVDFTCGWGSFLIASQERLSKLSDSDEVPLQSCIYGNDYNKFFTQLARLGLIYTTAKDDWHIDNRDIFQQQDNQDLQANVIIGNALFTGSNNKGNEKANQFLKYAIQQLKPGGYLAFIMPQPFVLSQDGSATRKKLLEECDILELWELPQEMFQGSTIHALIIFAQKKLNDDRSKPTDACVRIRTLQASTIDTFKSSGLFTTSSLTNNQSSWHSTIWKSKYGKKLNYVFDYTTIVSKSLWKAIDQACYKLYMISDIKSVNSIHYDDHSSVHLKNESLSQESKILLQYLQRSQWGNQVKLAIGQEKYYGSRYSYFIIPKHTLWTPKMANEVLVAILGWYVSNTWIIEHIKSPFVAAHVIGEIPIPKELSAKDCQVLTDAVLIMEDAAQTKQWTSPVVRYARDEIDSILRKAYHLDDSTFQRLRQVMQWLDRSYITLDMQPDLNKANWFTSGIVESINAAHSQIQLWIDGFDNIQTVHIVPSMPGWMLRPGAAFLTKFPREFRRQRKIDPENIDWAYFQPQPYMYMSEEELLTEISQHFVRPSQ